MKKNVFSVFLCVILTVLMTFSGIVPVPMSKATQTETVATAKIRQDLSVSPKGAVDLAWDAVDGASKYDLYMYDEGVWEVCASETDAVSGRIEELDDGATLFFRLQATDAQEKILAVSDVLTVYTAPATPQIQNAVVCADQCTVSWTAVDGADGYVVYADENTRIAHTQKTQVSFSSALLKDAFVSVCAYRYIDGIVCEGETASSTVIADTDCTACVVLGLNETISLAGYAVGETTCRSADEQVVRTDENGNITALKTGRTQVLVTTSVGSCVVTVTVLAAPQTVRFSENECILSVGEQKECVLLLNGAASFDRTYVSSDTQVVTVDKDGILTAVSAGSATVSVTLYNGVKAEMSVLVKANGDLRFTKETLTLGVGETVSNPVLSEGKKAENVRYYAPDDAFSVDVDGNITALKKGTFELKAKTADSAQAICRITVADAPKSLQISEDHVRTGVGTTTTLRVQADSAVDLSRVIWTSTDESVVTVHNGTVSAVGVGTASVTATLYNGVKAECQMTVLAAPYKLKLNKTTCKLKEGETHLLTATAQADAWLGTLTFKSSNPAVLTVDQSGNVKAVKSGSATVTVTTYNGVSVACVYTVLLPATKVTVTSSAMTFAVGMYARMTAVTDTGSGLDTAVWTVSDQNIAYLNAQHHLIAKKAGKVTVTVTLENGVTGSCTVTIQAAPTSISLNKTNLALEETARYRLTATVNSGAYSGAITFQSSDESVARVSADGTVIAVSPGTATITAETFNGKTATCTVTVKKQPTSISFGYSVYSQTQGSWFYVTVYDQDYDEYTGATFTSSDTSVATVAGDGLVHVLKMGTATITARSSNGKTATCRINVSRMQVKLISQLPDYPTGCEAASCAMLLGYYGYKYTTANMVDIIPRENIRYINGYPVGPDINEKFVGDPTCTYTSDTPGYGVFSPAVTKALQVAVDRKGGDETAVCITGCTYNELLGQLADGRPVIVWATYNMNVPSTINEWYIDRGNGRYEYFSYPRGTHVTVLCGYDGSKVYMMDPYDNACLSFSSSTFKARWDLLGNQGVILM